MTTPPSSPTSTGEVISIWQATLVRGATERQIVERAAKSVLRHFPHLVELDDLLQDGRLALPSAARGFDDTLSQDPWDYIFRRVRCEMLKSVEREQFEVRVRRSVMIATDQFWAYIADRDYNAAKHDDREARRRWRDIANGMLAAAFTAGVEEAARTMPDEESAERHEYVTAIQELRTAIAKLDPRQQQILTLHYRELMDLRRVADTLGMAYIGARRHHARALDRLREALHEKGVTKAPRPRDLELPDSPADSPQGETSAGAAVLAFRRPPAKGGTM
jgi:RNA polymerase sigma factor (sigma-70 family)